MADPERSLRGGAQLIPRPSTWRPGRPAPWADLPPTQRHVTMEQITDGLARADAPLPSPLEGTDARASAVLVPLYPERGQIHVVLTRRSQHLRSHRGEMSFPGGGQELGEDLRTTALREAYEETALEPDSVRIIGELDHLQTVNSGSFIVPFVGVLAGRPELTASPAEVELIRHVALDELLDDGIFHEEHWIIGSVERHLSFFDLIGDTIWGATATMLRNLLALATGTSWR